MMFKLKLSQKLHVLRMVKAGITPQATGSQFGIELDEVEGIVRSEATLLTMTTPEASRNNLTLGDKLCVRHLLDLHRNKSQVSRICKVHRKTVKNIEIKRAKLLADEANGIPLSVKRPLYAKYPALEADVIDFIKYARSKRLPVSSTHIKARALRAASKLSIHKFSASNGWLEKFLRRSAIQRSFKLHGKGGLNLPTDTAARMQQFHDISSQFDDRNIYSIDKSGLFYCMGPRMTYLTRDEDRSSTRGTELQKHKQRFSIVMCVNADGSHTLQVSYIGTAGNPKCFKDPRFTSMKDNSWSRSNGWMDSRGFLHCIEVWHTAVKKLSNGPWLPLMDNCGGYELSISIERVRIEFLPPTSTAKHQPLDLGLIASAKIRYRTNLLSSILNVMDLQRNTNHSFKENNGNGKWGLQDGIMPHVGDAKMLLDASWKMMARAEIIKCWIRSECLGVTHVNQKRKKF